MTTSGRPVSSSKMPSLAIGISAVTWGLVFAAMHVYWAVGGTLGLEGQSMEGLLLMINIVAIPLSFLAALIAYALMASWDKIIPRKAWFFGSCGAAILLGLRGTIGIIQTTLSDDPVLLLLMVYDLWFLLGGVLFSLVALVNHSR